jgi:NAD(P)-dependent dehydrogenase (short-subunit alcohol dehydrogenase family)
MKNLINYKLSGKKVIVTGISGQLGIAIARRLLKNKAHVIGLDKVLSEEIKLLAKKSEGRFEIYKLDITKPNEVSKLFNSLRNIGIDHLINNAGVSVFTQFWDRSNEELDYVIDVNLKGTIFCIKEYLNLIRESGKINFRGSIVNVASLYGVVSPDFRIYTDCSRINSEIYGATKAGIIQLTKYFAVYAANIGVRVNSVSPGGIFNEIDPQGSDFQKNYSYRCPIGRMASTDEIVEGTLFLISSGASYINGHNLIIDGGSSIW